VTSKDQAVELVRQCEDVVEVGHGQQFGLSRFEPLCLDQCLALGAVAIAARVVGEALEAALGAPFPVATERRRAAALDGVEDAMLGVGQALRAAIGWTVASHDVGQLARWSRLCPAPAMPGGQGHGR